MELQWPLVVFTTFICLSAGTFGFISVASMKKEYARIQLPGLITAFAALVIGGLASVLHLQTPARYFGQFGNITSGINQELIALGLVAIAMVVYFVRLRRKGDAGRAVKVVSALLSVVLVLVMSHSYMMASMPAWNTILLPLYYLLDAASLGALVMALLMAVCTEDDTACSKAIVVAIAAVVLLALAVVAFAVFFCSLAGAGYTQAMHVDLLTVPPVDPASIGERMLSGDLAMLFWGGVVAVGLVLPLAALVVSRKAPRASVGATATAVVLVFLGGLAFRALLYCAGASLLVY